MDPALYIVDDDPQVRLSLETLLAGNGLMAQGYRSAREFLEYYDPACPGCLVLSLRLEGMSGLKLQQEIRARNWPLTLVFLSDEDDVRGAVQAMRHGAVHVLIKPPSSDELLSAVNEARARCVQEYLKLARHAEIAARVQELTLAERRVLELTVAGFAQKQIAAQLDIALRTVQLHRTSLMRKMQAESLAELIGIWKFYQEESGAGGVEVI